MSNSELHHMLEELEISYYETGAYYDSDYCSFIESQIEQIESEFHLCIVL